MTLQGLFPRRWRLVRLAGDLASGPIAFLAAFALRLYVPLPLTQHLLPQDRFASFAQDWVVVVVTQGIVLYFFALYDPPQPSARIELFRRLVTATGLQGLLLMGFFFLREAYFFRGSEFPRSVVVLFVPINCVLLYCWRLLIWRLYPPRTRRVAIVGGGPTAAAMAESLRRQAHHGLELVGFIEAPGAPPEAPECHGTRTELHPVLGGVEDAPGLVARGLVDDFILASQTYPWQTRLLDGLSQVASSRSNVWLLPGPFESLLAGTRYYWVEDNPLIEVARELEWRINWPLKRGFDIVVGTLLLVLSMPVLGLSAVAVLLTSGRPVFYRQHRLGKDAEPFAIVKLRSMHRHAENLSGEVLARADDPRVTRVGRVLRRYRIDEIPQLWNVLAGTMSLVGPRPERPGLAQHYARSVPGYAKRYCVPPGLTGLAQVHGEYHSTPETKVRYDLAYIANWSLWLDLYILLRTVRVVLTSPGI